MTWEQLEKELLSCNFDALEKFIQKNPSDLGKLYSARLNIEKGNYAEATLLLVGIEGSKDFGLNVLYLKSLLELCQGNFPTWIEATLLKLAPEKNEYRISLAGFYYGIEKIAEALLELEKVFSSQATPSDFFKAKYLSTLIEINLEAKEPLVSDHISGLKGFLYKHGLWFLRPYYDYLDARYMLQYEDTQNCLKRVDFALREYSLSYFHRACLPLKRLKQELMTEESVSTEQRLEGKPQLLLVFNYLKSHRVISKETLIKLVDDIPYHPIHHDSKIYMIIRRLKSALMFTPLELCRNNKGWELIKRRKYEQKDITVDCILRS